MGSLEISCPQQGHTGSSSNSLESSKLVVGLWIAIRFACYPMIRK
jgi:hypothetical protein